MVSSIYFQSNYNGQAEQDLLESLVVEATNIHGIDVYFCPKVNNNLTGNLYLQDDQVAYTSAYLTEMMVDNVLGFQGDGQFLSKFAGVEIRDQIILTIPKLTWDNNVRTLTGMARPNEGDIIFWPTDKRVFIIRYVDKYSVLYQLGKIYQWRMTCELFEYSNEIFSTGIADLDRMMQGSTDMYMWSVTDTDGTLIFDENGNDWVWDDYQLSAIDPLADNDLVENTNEAIIDKTETDPFEDGGEIGKFL